MEFEWDHAKADANRAKHGVSFELARWVWDDPLHVILPDRVEDGEQRWHAIGLVGAIVVLVVVHSHPDLDNEDRVRIIGARKATSHERRRMSRKALSPEMQDQLNQLAALPDEHIDTSDIPEAPPEAWQHAHRPDLYRPRKQPVTLRLDADVVAWFKQHAHDRGYQTEINRVLRKHVADANP